MRKPDKLWYLESHAFVLVDKEHLVLQLTFRRYGLNHRATKELKVVQIPIGAHKDTWINHVITKAITQARTFYDYVYGSTTEVKFSQTRIPKFWILGDNDYPYECYKVKEKAEAYCKRYSSATNTFRTWELRGYVLEMNGRKLDLIIERDDEPNTKRIEIPLFAYQGKTVSDSASLCFSEDSANTNNPLKKFTFALDRPIGHITRWFQSTPNGKFIRCHRSKNILMIYIRQGR